MTSHTALMFPILFIAAAPYTVLATPLPKAQSKKECVRE